MISENYTGVILAAGRGSRMHPFSDRWPKPLLPIANKPLIVRQIETMRSIGISRILVLVGHKGFEISRVLGDGSQFGVNIRYVEQSSTLGLAHAVGRLEPHINGAFLLFLGDIFFVHSDLRQMFRMFEQQGGGAVLATREDDIEAIRRNFSITLSPEGLVTRVIEKPRHPQNRLKGVGIYLFDLPIFDAIRRTPRTAMRDEYELTDSIQVMIDDGNPVRPANVVLDDINLTNPNDLLRCNLIQASCAPATNLVGQNVRLHPEARVANSVIGANVVVPNPIAIVNSVIFDDTHVESRTDVQDTILTPECHVDCRYFGDTVRPVIVSAAAVV